MSTRRDRHAGRSAALHLKIPQLPTGIGEHVDDGPRLHRVVFQIRQPRPGMVDGRRQPLHPWTAQRLTTPIVKLPHRLVGDLEGGESNGESMGDGMDMCSFSFPATGLCQTAHPVQQRV